MKNLITALAIALLPAIATAQTCLPYDTAQVLLSEEHGEYRTMTMLTPDGALVEVWHNPQTESWTMIAVGPNGVACLIAEGKGVFMSVRPNV